MPIMVRSGYCSLSLHKGKDKSECEYDPGGYFIVNGSEKVVISQDKMCENKPLVLRGRTVVVRYLPFRLILNHTSRMV
ncbi:MAG: DNA-directed RNA polymerase subunit beta [Harvfovirus sp.]|uniref:DNA-directed RNA polymerase n=1 Tax=Harvfovirus sp. TaxID=2487768 RepID=A0A3G5A6W9_9VIRU|nr:MAG: DNA-directed RNA polymerase subunit beta [Harvfovirus sp.]